MKKLWSITFFIIGIILLFISISSYPIWFFLEYKYSQNTKMKEPIPQTDEIL